MLMLCYICFLFLSSHWKYMREVGQLFLRAGKRAEFLMHGTCTKVHAPSACLCNQGLETAGCQQIEAASRVRLYPRRNNTTRASNIHFWKRSWPLWRPRPATSLLEPRENPRGQSWLGHFLWLYKWKQVNSIVLMLPFQSNQHSLK